MRVRPKKDKEEINKTKRSVSNRRPQRKSPKEHIQAIYDSLKVLKTLIATKIKVKRLTVTDTLKAKTGIFGATEKMTLTDNEIDVSSGDLTIDVAGNINLDADGGSVTITDTTPSGYYPSLVLISTDANTAGPIQMFTHNSASPAIGDVLGEIFFQGDDSAGNVTGYASIKGILESPTSGSEEGKLSFLVADGSTSRVGYQMVGDDGKVNVNVGYGAASVTAVAGHVTVGTSLTMGSGQKLQFVDGGEHILGNGTDLTITSGRHVLIGTIAGDTIATGQDFKANLSGGFYIDADNGEARLTDDSNPGNTFVPADDADITTKKYVDGKRFAVTTAGLNYRMGTVNYYYVGNQSLGAAVGISDFARYEAPYAVYNAKDAVQVHSWEVYGSVSSSVSYQYELWDVTNPADGGSGNAAAAKIGSTQAFNGTASRMYTIGESGLDYTLSAGHQLYVVKRYITGSGTKYTYSTVTVQLEVI